MNDTVLTRLAAPFAVPRPMATREVAVSVTCQDGSVPPFLETVAGSIDGSTVEHTASAKGGSVTMTLLRDRAYALTATASIPDDADGPRAFSPRGRLAPVIVPPGAPNHRVALVAACTRCAVAP